MSSVLSDIGNRRLLFLQEAFVHLKWLLQVSKKSRLLCLCTLFFMYTHAQQAWFIDGYHGGKWGHYPAGYTAFIVEQLNKHPQWKINVEIEPETWTMVKETEPAAYNELIRIYEQNKGKIDFVNPAYGQPYFYNISGESIIRQFAYGIKETRKHFANSSFISYSSEEPCFTSAMPQVLRSFGFKYASLKNPNTCWGGYTKAYGGELVNWIGPDGTSIVTSPRYAIESLVKKSTWQTIAWKNDSSYVLAALRYGIANPVGMCLQDAGWKNGPWLGYPPENKIKTGYTTWTNYFSEIAATTKATNWKLSQEDILVSLVWGSQALQRIAQQVRVAENKMVQAEKIAAMASAFASFKWPGAALDSAWTRLLLAQHHDSWIVPYNGKPGDTWIDKVKDWTGTTVSVSNHVIEDATKAIIPVEKGISSKLRVFNTTAQAITAPVFFPYADTNASVAVKNFTGNILPVQKTSDENGRPGFLFAGKIPSAGYADFMLVAKKVIAKNECTALLLPNGNWQVESDVYKLVIDPSKGGTIQSLLTKKINKEWVDKKNARAFTEIRGRFYQQEAYLSSTDQPATIEVIEEGAVRVKVLIRGKIGDSPFQQTITLSKGEQRIDMDLTIDWQGSPGIGNDYKQKKPGRAEEYQKAFYDDRDKLLISFPLAISKQKIYKNAPFDVTTSQLSKTYFTTWDSIRNNVLLHWVDVAEGNGNYGMTVFSDHTGNYLHADDLPLGLNIQYAGQGLWGRNYTIDGPTHIRYALLPHQFLWDRGRAEQQRQVWNEPPVAIPYSSDADLSSRQLIQLSNDNWELAAMYTEGKDLLIRLYNAAGTNTACTVFANTAVKEILLESLEGKTIKKLQVKKEKEGASVILQAPRFSIRTLRLKNVINH